MQETQNFKNHVRWYPLVHYVLVPIFAFNLLWQIVRLYQEPNWDRAENLLLAVAFILLNIAARQQALKAQDRLIRLEETLRYKSLLTAELAEKASNLKTGQMLALRFASDEELPDLVSRTLNGEFKDTKEIKLAVKNWRGDYLRV
jgi:hypothetical protein